jgi:hypothetical protein
MSKFKENNYDIWKKAVSPEIANFLYKYFLLKKDVFYYLKETRYLSPYDLSWGAHGDEQTEKRSYISYCDIAMENLSVSLLPKLSKRIGINLHHQYSYTRCYYYGAELKRHMDRPECEISCTLNLGGDPWAIYIDPTGEKGNEGVKVILNQGDMMVYKGCNLEHWREPFEGDKIVQTFLHFNNLDGPYKDNCTKFDNKDLPGLPSYFSKIA